MCELWMTVDHARGLPVATDPRRRQMADFGLDARLICESVLRRVVVAERLKF